jgi:hypothetical protein
MIIKISLYDTYTHGVSVTFTPSNLNECFLKIPRDVYHLKLMRFLSLMHILMVELKYSKEFEKF